ncbi:hypothetical protein [Fusobacterium sp. PH5-44]|uniref:hypothetical protein n=1 Tax=unclassified Fusobacterium TaxID=2648384 RepID=UPI003D2172EA
MLKIIKLSDKNFIIKITHYNDCLKIFIAIFIVIIIFLLLIGNDFVTTLLWSLPISLMLFLVSTIDLIDKVYETEKITIEDDIINIKQGTMRQMSFYLSEIVEMEYNLTPTNSELIFQRFLGNRIKYKTTKIETKRGELHIGYKLKKDEFIKIHNIIFDCKENYEKLNNTKENIKIFSIVLFENDTTERYEFFLKKLIEEEMLYYIKSVPLKLWSGKELVENLEFFKDKNLKNVEFYRFYADNLTKKGLQQTKVSIMYNGETEKIITLEQLKNDINDVRDGKKFL